MRKCDKKIKVKVVLSLIPVGAVGVRVLPTVSWAQLMKDGAHPYQFVA